MVRRIFRKRHTAIGARPGTLVIDKRGHAPQIFVMQYGPEELCESSVARPAELTDLLRGETKVWVDVHGLGDESILRELGDVFQMHPLVLEDVVNVPQRPKAEPYDHHLLVITRMVIPGPGVAVEPEQVSILMGRNYVLTVQERPGDVFEPIRARLRTGKGLIRKLGPDYLAYALLDAVLDGYYPVLERFGEHLEDLEDRVVQSPGPALLKELHRIKRELLALRRAVWPQREAISALLREDNEFLSEPVRVYLRDCYDHCVQIMDAVETYREITSGLMDVYLSSLGVRQNEVMKVLTIMASIFIPLTFLAGVYGMNFENMPELASRWGYPLVLAVMLGIAVGMFFYFRRKGWIEGGSHSRDRETRTD